MPKVTLEEVKKRADEIFAERYTTSDILRMDTLDAHQICMEEALQELTTTA